MPYYLTHAGTSLQKVTMAGEVSTLTLPAGVTVSATKSARVAVLSNSIVAAYAPTLNLRINSTTLAVTPMSIPGPITVPTVAAGSSGVLTGVYLYKVTFAQVDTGVLVSESPLSSATAPVTLAAQRGSLSAIPVSTASGVTSRRLYRTTTGGSTYFFLATIADNTTTTYTDNTADAGLDITAVTTDLGNPAGTTTSDYLTEIVAWKDRLWAVGSPDLDLVYYSGINRFFAWSAANYFPINPKGQGTSGVTAFLPRRDELGVAKRRGLWKIVGSSADSYAVIQVINGVGVFAPKSVVVIRDVAYFLAEEGVYAWGADGLRLLNSARVNAWFTTDTYFNRSLLSSAFAVWNQRDDCYELYLADASSGVIDRWISYDLQRDLWLGPHKTDAFTPSIAQNLEDIYGITMQVRAGTDGILYRCCDMEYLDGATAIDFSVTTAPLSGGVPQTEKYYGELTVLTQPQAAGTLTVTPYVGGLTATAQASISHDLTLDRQKHRRLGQGRHAWLTLRQNGASQGCEVHGFEIVPVSIIGSR